MVQREPDRPPAQRGVFFPLQVQRGQHFIAAQIHCAEDDRLAIGLVQNALVEVDLVIQLGQRFRDEELKFSAEQAYAVSACLFHHVHVEVEPRIQHQRDFRAIGRAGWQILQRFIACLTF